MRKKLKKTLLNVCVLAGSCGVGLILCELGARWVLNPVDYLSPTLVRDDVLGIKLPPHASGHDAWGFRNPSVPTRADVVALGDSHTYGNSAVMADAWPMVLGRLLDEPVYSLGMGGYGPNQYYHLFREKALTLHPKVVVCGLYMGDDFDNAYRMSYGMSHWAYLRTHQTETIDSDIWETRDATSLQKRVRNWLSSHSIVYRIVIHGALSGLKSKVQIQDASAPNDTKAVLKVDDPEIEEVFSPIHLLKGLEQSETSVQEGMRITFTLLDEMHQTCVSNNTQFVLLIIPTKESVFARHLLASSSLNLSNTIEQVIRNEGLARQSVVAFLREKDIPYVDALPALRERVGKEKLYTPGASDMHPNGNGYRVIAEAVAKRLAELPMPPDGR